LARTLEEKEKKRERKERQEKEGKRKEKERNRRRGNVAAQIAKTLLPQWGSSSTKKGGDKR